MLTGSLPAVPARVRPHGFVPDAMTAFGSVLFDCDSTLSAIEGIDELAGGRREEIAGLTAAAMAGRIPLEEVYARRLELVRPTRDQVRALAARYVAAAIPDARETVTALLDEGIDVRIVSGGVRSAVCALARALGLGDDRVAAVDVYFDDAGAYAGFDDGSPLARTGGKRAVVERWSAGLPRPVMFVGDGATDLEVRPVVDRFVAFAGVAERPAVVRDADDVVRANSLAPVLVLALGGRAPSREASRAVFERGSALLGGATRTTPPQPARSTR
jgi:phosphoserine phosphatase